jgi:hypothetical protein
MEVLIFGDGDGAVSGFDASFGFMLPLRGRLLLLLSPSLYPAWIYLDYRTLDSGPRNLRLVLA